MQSSTCFSKGLAKPKVHPWWVLLVISPKGSQNPRSTLSESYRLFLQRACKMQGLPFYKSTSPICVTPRSNTYARAQFVHYTHHARQTQGPSLVSPTGLHITSLVRATPWSESYARARRVRCTHQARKTQVPPLVSLTGWLSKGSLNLRSVLGESHRFARPKVRPW